jgi:hypothetical protein
MQLFVFVAAEYVTSKNSWNQVKGQSGKFSCQIQIKLHNESALADVFLGGWVEY